MNNISAKDLRDVFAEMNALRKLRTAQRELRRAKKNYMKLGRSEEPHWNRLREISLRLTGKQFFFNVINDFMEVIDPEAHDDPLSAEPD